ncbi:hypothetical protein BO71DRAFT_400453 [Aspergillus ellipticus CBS 707.79]|uniref:Uncharacterized protein n=1 Tax=Aspergillus ellipticus CBS 707.79 TaxID=1448320 RepID=A0A319D559_9EURO|nr:hypothetical protein BO71DRAFT_400453 [Aspergillus ellipticus CBS 707.79]
MIESGRTGNAVACPITITWASSNTATLIGLTVGWSIIPRKILFGRSGYTEKCEKRPGKSRRLRSTHL